MPPKNESKIGSKEPENRQNLNSEKVSNDLQAVALSGNSAADILPPLAAALIQETIADYFQIPEIFTTVVLCLQASIGWKEDNSTPAGTTAYSLLCVQHLKQLFGETSNDFARIESDRVSHIHN